MKKLIFSLAIGALAALPSFGQTLDTEALAKFNPSTVHRVWDVAKHVKLSAAQQKKLATAFETNDATWLETMKKAGGVEEQPAGRRYQKLNEKAIDKVLDKQQVAQYYRGVFDAEANAEGNAVANRLQKKYNLTDQNWKFIRIAFYKIALDSRVINKMMADNPKEAKKKIEALRKEQLASIEAKGGIRVDPEGQTVTVVRPFDPNALHKD